MAERTGESSKVKQWLSDHPEHALHFLEVLCKSTGKVRRFAAGTDAGFALNLINKKINGGERPLASHIEAFKDGEEEVSFGPNSVLVDYGLGWKLQTVIESEGLQLQPQQINRNRLHLKRELYNCAVLGGESKEESDDDLGFSLFD